MPQKAKKAPDILYNQASIKLVDYVIKRDMTKWSLNPDSEFQREEKERDKSVVRTDQGEYFTRVYQRYALPDLDDPYWIEITKEDPALLLNEKWHDFDWIELAVRENTLRGDPLSLFRFAIIPLKKGVGKGETKEAIIRAFKNPTGHFRLYRYEDPNHPDYMVWPLRGAVRLLDPAKFDRYRPSVTRDSPKGIPNTIYVCQRPLLEMVKDPIFSIVLKLDRGESRLLPCQNDEELERRIDWTREYELMSVTLGTRANLDSVEESWSDND